MRFRLAEQLGCTVAELERRMSAAEFTEWVGYHRWKHKQAAKT